MDIKALTQKLIELDYDPLVLKDRDIISLQDLNLYLILSERVKSYCLVKVFDEKLNQFDILSLHTIDFASVRYSYVIIENLTETESLIGIKSSEFPVSDLTNLREQIEYFNTAVLPDACERISKINKLNNNETKIEYATRLKKPNSFIEGSNSLNLKYFLNTHLNISGTRLILIRGNEGIGKKTTLRYLLNTMGWEGYALNDEGGKEVGELNIEYRVLSGSLFNRHRAVMVVSSILTDDILKPRYIPFFESMIRLFKSVAAKIPVILISNDCYAKPDFITSSYEFQEEDDFTVLRIIKKFHPFYKWIKVTKPDENSSIANPLFSLRKIELLNYEQSNNAKIKNISIIR